MPPNPSCLASPLMLLNSVTPVLKKLTCIGKDQKENFQSLSPQTPTPEEKVAPGEIVDEIAQKVLAGMPLRLINLDTGTFSSAADLFRTFKRSPEYQTLVSDKPLSSDALSEKADSVVRNYFAYVMLSHVWGEDEPLYRDVLDTNIFEISSSSPGIQKLQQFCRIAKQRGFHLCWSDTCCIDKLSSAELQESINSMFTWYRNSTLTIAFLMDVLQPTLEALKRSRWFTRGWTLQELLAPIAIQFYMGNWTPFQTSSGAGGAQSNYKLIPEFVQYLEDILGIDKSFLVDFKPGLTDVRERLRWMATRKTTKPEDMAYCLLGVLDLRLPILYGEGDRAFIRLQDEIMKNTDDTCIFDWVGQPSSLNSYLAHHPSCFHQLAWRPSPYQTTAELPVLGAVSDFAHKLGAGLLRLTEELLTDPPLGHFIANGRMNLRTFVYQVKSLELAASTSTVVHKQTAYMYHVKADGLEPLTVITGWNFPNPRSEARSLSICRVWDNALRAAPTTGKNDKSVDTHDDPPSASPWELKIEDYLDIVAKRLRSPFVAQLLVVHPNGQFRRVHTVERIVAQPRIADLLDLRTPRTLIVH